MPEKAESKQLICTGMDYRQPLFSADGYGFVASYEINWDQLDIDDFCDSDEFMKEQDPRRIYSKERYQ